MQDVNAISGQNLTPKISVKNYMSEKVDRLGRWLIDWVGGLGLLADYVTGPLAPKTRAKYFPSHA
jgi:hypothetical protein